MAISNLNNIKKKSTKPKLQSNMKFLGYFKEVTDEGKSKGNWKIGVKKFNTRTKKITSDLILHDY